jgi:hypothetical protein
MELERMSKTQESGESPMNGLRTDALKLETPKQEAWNNSPKSFGRATPPPGSPPVGADPGVPTKEVVAMAKEMKQLKAQLQGATEKWARDKQMFAEARSSPVVCRSRLSLSALGTIKDQSTETAACCQCRERDICWVRRITRVASRSIGLISAGGNARLCLPFVPPHNLHK